MSFFGHIGLNAHHILEHGRHGVYLSQFVSFAFMDLNFETVLYVIILIIGFIVQSGSKNKKRRQQERQEASEEVERPDRRPTFEELLEEFTGQKTVKPRPQPVIEVQEEKKEPKPFFEVKPRQSTYEAAQKRAEERKKEAEREAAQIRSRFNERFEPFEMEEEVEESGYASMFRDLDSTKRAFVASEIFKRKYN